MCPRPALRALTFVSLFTTFTVASDLKIRVIDPQAARVAGAQVSVYRPSDGSVLALLNTDARGEASLLPVVDSDHAAPERRHLGQSKTFAEVREVEDVLLETGAAETH